MNGLTFRQSMSARSALKVHPTRRASRLGFAEIGARRPPHVGGGMKETFGLNEFSRGQADG